MTFLPATRVSENKSGISMKAEGMAGVDQEIAPHYRAAT
jgi:hypothetical protein